MPIRKSERARYPKDWYAISMRVRQAAGWKCVGCGVPHGEVGGRDLLGRWHKALSTGCNGRLPRPGEYGWCAGWDRRLRIVKIVLTVAHLDHQPENCADENLRCWCQRCHNLYDAAHRARGIKERARAKRACKDLFL